MSSEKGCTGPHTSVWDCPKCSAEIRTGTGPIHGEPEERSGPGGWWCHGCEAPVDDQNVTYQETHVYCGGTCTVPDVSRGPEGEVQGPFCEFCDALVPFGTGHDCGSPEPKPKSVVERLEELSKVTVYREEGRVAPPPAPSMSWPKFVAHVLFVSNDAITYIRQLEEERNTLQQCYDVATTAEVIMRLRATRYREALEEVRGIALEGTEIERIATNALKGDDK